MKLEFCNACGGKLNAGKHGAFKCDKCHRVHYANPKPAVGIFLFTAEGQVVLSVRSREPEKGKLDILGGFVDLNESLEEALYRELDEEAGLVPDDISDVEYVGSAVNYYKWGEDNLPTLTMYYKGVLIKQINEGFDDVASIEYLAPSSVKVSDVAWPPIFEMLQLIIESGAAV